MTVFTLPDIVDPDQDIYTITVSLGKAALWTAWRDNSYFEFTPDENVELDSEYVISITMKD
jgi:hypothetical protein